MKGWLLTLAATAALVIGGLAWPDSADAQRLRVRAGGWPAYRTGWAYPRYYSAYYPRYYSAYYPQYYSSYPYYSSYYYGYGNPYYSNWGWGSPYYGWRGGWGYPYYGGYGWGGYGWGGSGIRIGGRGSGVWIGF